MWPFRTHSQLAVPVLLVFLACPGIALGHDSILNQVKRQVEAARPKVLAAEDFQIGNRHYAAMVIKNPELAEERIRIYSLIDSTIDTEEYDSNRLDDRLIGLSVTDLTDDGIPEIVTTWGCGRSACLNVVMYNVWTDSGPRFKEVFAAQADDIELGPKTEGKPREIRLTSQIPDPTKGQKVRTDTYVWQNGKGFVLTSTVTRDPSSSSK